MDSAAGMKATSVSPDGKGELVNAHHKRKLHFFMKYFAGSISDFLGKVMSFPHHAAAAAASHPGMAAHASMFAPYYGGGIPYMEKAATAAAAAAAAQTHHL